MVYCADYLMSPWRLLLHMGRILARDPGLTIAVAVTLALGIGPNVTMFSIINAVLWRSLPYRDAERIVQVTEERRPAAREAAYLTAEVFEAWRERPRTLQALAGYRLRSQTLTTVEGPVRIGGAAVSADLFALLGVEPALGRGFDPGHERAGAERVVLLGSGVWERLFGRDPTVVGGFITLGGERVRVTGVMPASFQFPDAGVELWTPLVPTLGGSRRVVGVGRLRAGISVRQAETEGATVARNVFGEIADAGGAVTRAVRVTTLREAMFGDSRTSLLILWIAVGGVLAVACANAGNLILSRGPARRAEVVLRSALGASGWRLATQALVEGAVLGGAGGVLGLVLGVWLLRVTLATVPQAIPRAEAVHIDVNVLGFAIVLSVVVGMLTSAAPALRRSSLGNASLVGGWGTVAKRERRAAGGQVLQRPLTVLQVSIAVTLLTNITLLAGSFLKFVGNDLGYEPTDVLTVRVTLSRPADEHLLDIGSAGGYFQPVMRAAVERLGRLPGVAQAGLVSFLPLRSPSFRLPLEIRGQPLTGARERREARPQLVTPGYFRAMGMQLVDGAFPTSEIDTAGRWTVVNETFVRWFLNDRDALGQALRFREGAWLEIVGVTKDVVQTASVGAMEPEVYVSYLIGESAPFFSWAPYAVLKTRGEATEVVGRLRDSLRELDSSIVMDDVATMDGRLATAVALPRLFIFLLSVFAVTAAGIAFVGVYGLVYQDVVRRRREIGIRMALGASRGSVLRSVLGGGLSLLVAGTAGGLLGAVASHRLFSHLVIGTNPPVVLAYVVAPVLMGAVCLFACWVAARRGTQVDPLGVIRESAG